MAIKAQAGDRWQTFKATLQGGLNISTDALSLSTSAPGAATALVNFEVGKYGGYRRVNGFAKYSSTAVTGSGQIYSVAVFGSGVIASKVNSGNIEYYSSTGTTWTKINSDTRGTTGLTKGRFVKYRWTSSRIVFVDGTSYAAKWDGSTWTPLSGTSAPTNPTLAAEFKNHLVLSGYSANPNAIIISAPADDTVWNTGGAIELVVGDQVMAIKTFRDVLYIFCRNGIYKLSGSSTTDYAITPVTRNIGCVATDSVQEINGDLVFLAQDGIRPVAATERIGDVEVATLSRPIAPLLKNVTATYSAANVSSVVINSKNQYRLFLCDSAGTATAAYGVIGGLRQEPTGLQWEWGELRGFHAACADCDIISTTETVVHGGYDGYVYQQESGYNQNGNSIYAQFRLPYYDFGQPTIRKTVYKIKLYLIAEGAFSITCSTILDYSISTTQQPANITLSNTPGSVAVWGGSGSTWGTMVWGATTAPTTDSNLVGSAFSVGFNFITQDVLPCYTIQAVVIDYALNSRR